MEEEDHFTQTQLPALIAALAAAAMAARLLPLQPFTFTLLSSYSHNSTHFALTLDALL
jgi:flagellar biosynthesis component FlhA